MASPEMPLSSIAPSQSNKFGSRKPSLGESQSELALNAKKIKPSKKDTQKGSVFGESKFKHRGRTFSSLLGGNIRRSQGYESAQMRQSGLETAKDSQGIEPADSNVKQSVITSMETGFNWLTGAKMSQVTKQRHKESVE